MFEFIQSLNLFFKGPDHLTQDFNDYIQIHLIAWQHLAAICEGKALRLFKLRPKHHQCDHTRTQVARTKLNPRKVMQCFGDESFLGYWKQIGVKCHASSVLTRIYQRYLMFLSLRWRDARGDWLGVCLKKQRGCIHRSPVDLGLSQTWVFPFIFYTSQLVINKWVLVIPHFWDKPHLNQMKRLMRREPNALRRHHVKGVTTDFGKSQWGAIHVLQKNETIYIYIYMYMYVYIYI